MSAKDEFFDKGWCWMSHPDRNNGNAIPVFMYEAKDGRFYVPLDPSEGGELCWDERDEEWEMIQSPMAHSDAEFALYCARVAAGHLGDLVNELQAELAALKAAQQGSTPIYLVQTGQVCEGAETYTRHEGKPPPMCDYEGPLYARSGDATDATRYRWLRERMTQDGDDYATFLSTRGLFSEPWPADLDAAIDAAIQSTPAPHGRE